MISEDSDLYREHPDWALTIQEEIQFMQRNQLGVGFLQKGSCETIYLIRFAKYWTKGNIEYVKWDMNRSLMDVFSRERKIRAGLCMIMLLVCVTF